MLAVDYGSARTGIAVSDPTGTVARPLAVVERAATDEGLARLLALARDEAVERIVVGLPLTLRGERGAQAGETERFLEILRGASDVPIESFDERSTTVLGRRGSTGAPEDPAAAAHLPATYLEWLNARGA